MPTGTDSPSDKGEGGAAPDSAAIQKLIDDAVGKALAARLPRVKNTEETIAKMVAEAVAKLVPAEKPSEQPAGNVADGERPTVKALQEKFDKEMGAIRAQLQAEQKARSEAEVRAKDARMRSEVQARLAAKLGADHPMLPTLMDSLYDVKKRFVEQDGIGPAVKFKSQYGGDDELKPLEEGVNALFEKGGELHHMVQHSKAQNLPPTHVRGVPQEIPRGQPGAGRSNPLYEVAAAHFASQGEHDKAAALASFAQPNGTPPK